MGTGKTARAVALYAAASLVVMGIGAGVLLAFFDGPANHRAILVSGIVGFVVQVAAFVLARALAERGNGIAGWGLGAAICFVVLIVFGFASKALGLPQSAALVSLATYFTLSELIEGPFLFL
jgi:hypothetical protein